MKAIFKGFILVGVFLGALFLMQQVDWRTIFHLKKVQDKTEEKVGEMVWEIVSQTEEEVVDTAILAMVDTVFREICLANGIESSSISLHVIKNDQVNAFAIPGNHIIIYSGLIASAKNESEFAGVLSHELAHLQKNHVMKKLIKEVGFSVLVDMTAGGGGVIVKKVAQILSSSAYDRSLEEEADLQAVEYLGTAGYDARQFGEFMYRLSDEDSSDSSMMVWISTHPDSKDRAEYIIKSASKKGKSNLNYSAEQWESLSTQASNLN
ncbi:MAG: M48 family metallopeptidase [Arcticibacter sp.]